MAKSWKWMAIKLIKAPLCAGDGCHHAAPAVSFCKVVFIYELSCNKLPSCLDIGCCIQTKHLLCKLGQCKNDQNLCLVSMSMAASSVWGFVLVYEVSKLAGKELL